MVREKWPILLSPIRIVNAALLHSPGSRDTRPAISGGGKPPERDQEQSFPTLSDVDVLLQ